MNIDAETDFIETNRTRTKRQSNGREALCQVNTQFVTPQAALNNRGGFIFFSVFFSLLLFIFFFRIGNWMYVINQDDSARQLVKTEVCA